jgi:hypothetical protein
VGTGIHKAATSWRGAILLSNMPSTAKLILLAMSCHYTDLGEGLIRSLRTLERDTGLSRHTIIDSLKIAVDAGWITITKSRINGKIWKSNAYFPAWPAPPPSAAVAPPPSAAVAPPPSAAVAPPVVQPLHTTSRSLDLNKLLVQDSSSKLVSAEDRELAGWLFEKIRKIHPSHAAPSWVAWVKDIRLMRELDKRTRSEIANLFEWANADPFWRINIRSPAKLRKHWDTLVMKSVASGAHYLASHQDRRCAFEEDGARCPKRGVFGLPDGRWHCAAHFDELERRVSAMDA